MRSVESQLEGEALFTWAKKKSGRVDPLAVRVGINLGHTLCLNA
jgi:hypothetical protein